MLIKSALRDWLSLSYGMKNILLTGSLRSPPPLSGLRRTYPCSRGRIKPEKQSIHKQLTPKRSFIVPPLAGVAKELDS